MKTKSRWMAVLCLVTSLSGTALAETVKGTSSAKNGTTPSTSKAKSTTSAGSSKAGTTKAKAKAKSSAESGSASKATNQKASLSSPKGEDNPNPAKTGPRPAAVTSINVDELAGFDDYPKKVRSLVSSAVALTHLGLTYTFGSSEPSKGGMDCSGTMYHVLRFQGLKDVPRQSDEMCAWVRDQSRLRLTPTAQQFSHPEFDALRPGDLLFWTGTMETQRKLPVTHVMLYLGKLKSTGKRVVFGSSDGRSYEGQRRCGVSVFDFDLPRPGGKAAFYGYGPAPGLAAPEYLEEIRKAELPVIAAAEAALPAPLTTPEPVPVVPAAPKKVEAMQKPEVAVVTKTPAAEKPRLIPGEEERPSPAPASSAKVAQKATSTAKTTASSTSSQPKATTAKPSGSSGGKAKVSTTSGTSTSGKGTATKSSAVPAKKTSPTTTSKPVAVRPKAAPAKPESTPEKVEKAMRRAVNSIRGAFQ